MTETLFASSGPKLVAVTVKFTVSFNSEIGLSIVLTTAKSLSLASTKTPVVDPTPFKVKLASLPAKSLMLPSLKFNDLTLIPSAS